NDESIKHLSQRSNGRATPRRRRWAALTNRQDSCGWGEIHVACSTARAGSQYVGSVTICWDVLLFPRDPELLHSRIERGGLHAEVLCGSPLTADAPPRQLEHGSDMLMFDLLERRGSPRTAPAAGRHWPPAQVELGTRTEDRRPLDHVFKLANIARPGIGLEHLHDCRRDIRDPLPQSWAILQRQVPHQEGNIFCPFAERRYANRKDVEAIVEVGPKSVFPNGCLEIAVRRRDHANVDRDRMGRSDPLELAFLENPEELWLELERQVADLVQEECPPMGQF